MLKLFKKAFKYTNEGIILAIPLIFFIWLITLYLAFARGVVDTYLEAFSAILTLLCMVGAFCAGWFYMVKESIEISKKEFILDEEKAKEIFNLIKKFPAGVGNFFISFIGLSLIILIIFALFAAGIYKIGLHFIGSIDFTAEQIKEAMTSAQDMKIFLDSLSMEQLYKLANWNMLFLAASTIMSYLLMLWVPEIIYRTPNPVLGLFYSIKKLFCKFWKSIGLFAYLTILNIIISFANTFALIHPIIYMILMVIYFYFLVYVVVLIFTYYDENFNKQDETEAESDSGSRSDG